MEENEKQIAENEKINPADIIFDDEVDDMPQPDTYDYDAEAQAAGEPSYLKMSMLFKYAVHSCMEKLPYSMDVLTNSEGKKIKVTDILQFIDDNFDKVITIDNMNLLISFIANAPKYAVESFMDLVEHNQKDLWTLIQQPAQ